MVPDSVISYVRDVFSNANDRVSGKFHKIPNLPEETFDISLIDALSDQSRPVISEPGWAVQINTHFIGSIRHHRRYEIADIGVVILFKNSAKIQKRKLLLLQSKRLYPDNFVVREFEEFDYELGLGLLFRDSPFEVPIATPVMYNFSVESKYSALRAGSQQCQAIFEHIRDTKIDVHYMFYNPLVVPCEIIHPVEPSSTKIPCRSLGIRILKFNDVQDVLERPQAHHVLALRDLVPEAQNDPIAFGHSIEGFICDAIRCREGYQFNSNDDAGISRLFNRKSGPIFCIIEVIIEGD